MMMAGWTPLSIATTSSAVLEPGSGIAASREGSGELRLRDKFGRAITDLRVSVTDRCNYRCVYCRTGNEGAQYAELKIADYLRMVRVFVDLGVEKVRLTGGEPLLRGGLVEMVEELSRMRTSFLPDGTAVGEDAEGLPLDIALTTNGHLLEGLAQPLKDAGLSRVTVSMDAVDAETFTAITRVPRSFDKVLAGIRAAKAAGLGPVKVNCVLLRGFNDGQIEQCAEFSRREGVIVRFIEWMPLEEDRTWKIETVVTMEEIVERLNRFRPVVELAPNAASETAKRFTFDDGLGEIGIIAPVSRPFCGHCSRVRLTSDGKIRTCLFSQSDHDLYGVLARGGTDREMRAYVRRVVMQKEARHHIGEPEFEKPSRSMVHIGG
ncbi:MAG: GTP 3',8-cyclase MoaA [Acidobacteriaceae bacterium]